VSAEPPVQEDTAQGKLGLALSGGGFRAAYFHLGTLAGLAELGLLREVQVVSTVSGGSIVGALYYLHLKNLFESVERKHIEAGHYIAIVRHMIRHFDEDVRRDLRASVYANPFLNIAMASPAYSRTDRIAGLLESRFYRSVWRSQELPDGLPPLPGPVLNERRRANRIEMRKLVIQPLGHHGPFDPDKHNSDPTLAKVPILLLNASTLNTGHGWRFEAMYMGELNVHRSRPGLHKEDAHDPDQARADVDKDATLARTPYSQMEEEWASFPLGTAVAASGAFPGLVKPVGIERLFAHGGSEWQRWRTLTVRLMDGGAHDNQGVEALIDRGCTHLIVSDASAQMEDIDRPIPRFPSVLSRASSILGDRVREQQLRQAFDRPLALMHLEKGLPAEVLYPRNRDGDIPPPRPIAPEAFRTDAFHVHEEVQRRLARIRTDLDAFSAIESKSLMFDGHAMTRRVFQLPQTKPIADLTPWPVTDEPDWSFGSIAEAIRRSPRGRYRRQLEASTQRFLKPFYVRWPWVAPTVLLALVLAAGGFGIDRLWDSGTHLSGSWTAIGFFAAVAAAVLYAKPDIPVLGWIGFIVYELLVPLALGLLSLALWVITYPTGWLLRKIFLYRGREPARPRRT
jgi:NTE family protein